MFVLEWSFWTIIPIFLRKNVQKNHTTYKRSVINSWYQVGQNFCTAIKIHGLVNTSPTWRQWTGAYLLVIEWLIFRRNVAGNVTSRKNPGCIDSRRRGAASRMWRNACGHRSPRRPQVSISEAKTKDCIHNTTRRFGRAFVWKGPHRLTTMMKGTAVAAGVPIMDEVVVARETHTLQCRASLRVTVSVFGVYTHTRSRN